MSGTPRVVVLDYGFGNVRSAVRAVERAGATAELTSDREAAQNAHGLVVPGVGAFAACMRGLRQVGGPDVIDRRLAGSRPVLGICVGMQVLFECGDEHGVQTKGIGEWPGTVEQLQSRPLPHMGWNNVSAPKGSTMFAGVERERFYFVHSYGVRNWAVPAAGRTTGLATGPTASPAVAWAEHGDERFVAAVENGPLWATQFHPEKSGDAGARLLENWLRERVR